MTFYNLKDFDALFAALDDCESDVVLTTEDGCQYDWNTQKNALRSFAGSMRAPHLRQLGIHTAAASDLGRLLRFAIYAGKHTA